MRLLDGITDSMDMSLSKLEVGDGLGSLACCSPQGHKESDMTWQVNNSSYLHEGTTLVIESPLKGPAS